MGIQKSDPAKVLMGENFEGIGQSLVISKYIFIFVYT
jgi:hypothetical protein